MKIRIVVPFIFLAAFLLLKCAKEGEKPKEATAYDLPIPKGFPAPFLSVENPLTAEGIRLGKKLFYDDILSSNGRACGSCHLQENAFIANNAVMGLDPAIYRNIPSLVNLAWQRNYTWTGAATDLDHVAIGDFGPDFFNSQMDTVLNRIQNHSEYPRLFQEAFPDVKDLYRTDVFQQKTAFAIAQFLRTITSAGSRYDHFIAGNASFSNEESYGMELFMSEKGDCFHCHTFPLFTDLDYHNIGLNYSYSGQNKGRFDVTGNNSDLGRFRTPSLRNCALTAPYMHDGRFQTLEEVIEHYNSAVADEAHVDPLMYKGGSDLKLHLSDFEKKCLVKFLYTLTDSSLLSNTNYAP